MLSETLWNLMKPQLNLQFEIYTLKRSKEEDNKIQKGRFEVDAVCAGTLLNKYISYINNCGLQGDDLVVKSPHHCFKGPNQCFQHLDYKAHGHLKLHLQRSNTSGLYEQLYSHMYIHKCINTQTHTHIIKNEIFQTHESFRMKFTYCI